MECLNQAIIIRLGATVWGNVQTCGILAHLWAITLPRQPGDNEQMEKSCDSASSLMSRRICFRVDKSRRDYENSHDDYGESGSACLYWDRSTALSKTKVKIRVANFQHASVIFGDGSLQQNTWRHCTHREDEVWNYTERNHEF